MNRAERFVALAETAPFDRLGTAELMSIATIARHRQWAVGAPLGAVGRVLARLHVVVEGGFVDHRGAPGPPVLGIAGVLQDRPQTFPWTAGPTGATTLTIARGHLFTILYACPEVTLGLADLPRLTLEPNASPP